jgi:hypothetical protein
MSDLQKLLRIYIADSGIRVMVLVGAGGLALALTERKLYTVGLFALGWGLYLLEEHLIHRYIFHAPAPRNQFLFNALYRLHYGHHDQARNRDLLFTPLWFALPMALVTASLLAILLPAKHAAIAVLGGGVSGYLVFEWLHLLSHFRTPKGRLGRYITRRHAKHHERADVRARSRRSADREEPHPFRTGRKSPQQAGRRGAGARVIIAAPSRLPRHRGARGGLVSALRQRGRAAVGRGRDPGRALSP